MSIKEKANKLRDSNGNSKISNNDLLWYLVGEVDELKEKYSKQESKIAKLQGVQAILIMLLTGIIVKVMV